MKRSINRNLFFYCYCSGLADAMRRLILACQRYRVAKCPALQKAPRTAPPADASRYDLARDEARGGHTLEKHVGRSDQELRERLDRERNISAASTWTNRELAEETVAQALRAERDKIARWEERGYRRPNLALHFDAGRVIGRSMRHGDESSSPATASGHCLESRRPE